MHDDGLLEQKAWAAGIASGYHDVDGRYYPAKPGVLAALLARLADEEHAEGDFDAVEVRTCCVPSTALRARLRVAYSVCKRYNHINI